MVTTRASGDVCCVCSTGGVCHRLHLVLPLVLVASVSPYAAAASSLTSKYVGPVATKKQRLLAASQSPVVRRDSVAGTDVPPHESAAQVQQKAVSKRRRTPLDRNPSSRRWIPRSVLQSNAKARVLAVAAALVAAIVAVVIRIRCSRYYIEKGGGWGNSLRWRRLSEGHDDREPLCSSYWDVGTENDNIIGPTEGEYDGLARRGYPPLPEDAQRNGQPTTTSRGSPTAKAAVFYVLSRLFMVATLALFIYIFYRNLSKHPPWAGNSTARTTPASTTIASTGRTTSTAFTSVETTDAGQSTHHTTNANTTGRTTSTPFTSVESTDAGQSTHHTTNANTTGAADGLAAKLPTEDHTTDGEDSNHPTSSYTTDHT